MSSWIWSQSDLMRLAGHNQPVVRQWACERLGALYGKAGLEVLEKLLRDKDREVLLEALIYLEDYPDPKFSDRVLKAYETNTGAVAGRCALILGRFKEERLISAYGEKIKTNTIDSEERIWVAEALGELATDSSRNILRGLLSRITEETDPELIDILIRALLKAKEEIANLLAGYALFYRTMPMEILYPFTVACGSWYSLEDLEREEKKKLLGKSLPPVVSESLTYLKDKGLSSLSKDLQQAFSKRDYRQVIEKAWQWAEKRVEEKRGRGEENFLLQSDLPPWINFRVLRAFQEFSGKGPEDSLKGVASATLIILAKFVELENLWGLKVEEIDRQSLFPILFEDRDEVPMDGALVERILAENETAAIFDHCLKQLKEHPESYGTGRAVRLMGKLKDPRAIPFLMDLLGEGEYGDLQDPSGEALVQMGGALIDYLEKNFAHFNAPQLAEVPFLVRDIPEEKTVDFLLLHWDQLWDLDKVEFLDALEGIASRRIIDPLRKELREGERREEEAFYLFCHIHGINDDLLPQIEKSMIARREEEKKRMQALRGNDLMALRQNTIKVELKCRGCGKPYLYEVENIYFSLRKKGKPVIADKIVCKNCRAINQYEITAKGHLAITSHLLLTNALIEEDRLKPGEGPVRFGDVGLTDGRLMSMEKALGYYQEEIQKSPQDPALRVGYGNLLLNKGMEEEAVRQYKEALKLDPLAVEAYASLGQFEADKRNASGAYEYFCKAAERIHTGHYYRTKEIDRAKEAILTNMENLRSMLGKDEERFADFPSSGILKKEKTGRNAPCPCGSGKKYKKCCLPKEEAQGSGKTSATPMELDLRDQLLSFSANAKYKKDFERAYSLYWGKPFREPLALNEKEEANFSFFLDWFIHDFKLGSGLTLVEEFYRGKKEKLSPEEHSLLQSEMASHFSVYEVCEVNPEVGLKLKDLFMGESLDIVEVSGTRTLAKWDIIFGRVNKMGPINKFSGVITFIPRRGKDGILSNVRQAWDKFKEETGKTAWSDFAKSNGRQIHQIIMDQPRIEPRFFTEERHPVFSAKAVFAATNLETIRYRLRQEFDFSLDEEKEGKEMRWTWLKRGESKDWETGEEEKNGVVLRSEIVLGKGELKWVSLGIVTWTPGRLELWCLSKERLSRGKKRLKEILGEDIRHLADTYEDMKKMAKRKAKEGPFIEDEAFQEKFFPLLSKTMEEWAHHWVDESIPALDGKTPREAVKTPEGRAKVEDLLKDFENMEERKRREGEAYLDIQVIRQRLNL